jgi:4-hydroxythreonine-4-phosphate dehydrogenase
MTLPRIAITMGDPCGIGPEIVVKALRRPELQKEATFIVVAALDRLHRAETLLGASTPPTVGSAGIEWIDVGIDTASLPFGQVHAQGGEVAFRCVQTAAALGLVGRIDAVATAPLNKEALHLAGHRYPGHTELLAHLCATREVSMLLTAPGLRVVHVTTHMGLVDAIERIDAGLVERTIARGRAALRALGIDEPRIAVCGINPHAGENNLFGRGEEGDRIVPAVRACQARGWSVEGPLPADTLFYRARRGDFDLVVAMYHDQGHGPVKVLGLDAGVNITLGLPFVRTSVDHGTAFDIAGLGVADDSSLTEAIRQAVQWTPAR